MSDVFEISIHVFRLEKKQCLHHLNPPRNKKVTLVSKHKGQEIHLSKIN